MPDRSTKQTAGPNVVCLIGDALQAFEFGIAYEVFGMPRPELGSDWYQFGVCTQYPGVVRTSGGIETVIRQGLEALDDADLIIIPGWPDMDATIASAVTDALLAAYHRRARLVSLCSGVVVLAHTGLLDGRRATTHWRFIETIAERFPAVVFDADVLYVDLGNIQTAAGSAAGIDLCLHIVRQDFGVEIANSIARGLVMPPHREGGQSQFIPQPVPKGYEASRLGSVIEVMQRNLHKELLVKELADEAGMSLRTFQRRFEALTGLPPSAWILHERLHLACRLLEADQSMSLEEVALKSGFGTMPTMRHHFRQKMQVSPSQYRKTFSPLPSRSFLPEESFAETFQA
ncbi:transcriptional regulator FtrA [Gynuella sp.]|uniref:transcriptional regulator FtrA n=1 Tax=Gynuella sp. TaxID=2969146 RepID=UPI003D1365B0